MAKYRLTRLGVLTPLDTLLGTLPTILSAEEKAQPVNDQGAAVALNFASQKLAKQIKQWLDNQLSTRIQQ